MPDNEVAMYWGHIKSSVDRMLLCLKGLDEADLNWKPLDNANSLLVIATHMIANIEANILGVLCLQNIDRHREEEFKARGSSTGPILQKWLDVQDSISAHLMNLTSKDLDKEYVHPRREKITGRDLMIVVARHAAEHVGHAELTRDLLFTARGRALLEREF
jgi:hypothetical protein